MAALWTVEYVGGAIRVRRHRSQADAEAYRDAVLRADGRFLTCCTVGSGEAGTGRCRLSFASHADVVEKTGGTH